MELHLEKDLPHQQKAVDAICDVFEKVDFSVFETLKNFSSRFSSICIAIIFQLPLSSAFKDIIASVLVAEPEKKSTQIESSSAPILNSFFSK